MTRLLHDHPITARLYGWGTPTLFAFGAGGVAFAVFVGFLLLLVGLVAWA